MQNNFKKLCVTILLPIICLLSACNSIEGSDKRIPNVGTMNYPEDAPQRF